MGIEHEHCAENKKCMYIYIYIYIYRKAFMKIKSTQGMAANLEGS